MIFALMFDENFRGGRAPDGVPDAKDLTLFSQKLFQHCVQFRGTDPTRFLHGFKTFVKTRMLCDTYVYGCFSLRLETAVVDLATRQHVCKQTNLCMCHVHGSTPVQECEWLMKVVHAYGWFLLPEVSCDSCCLDFF